MFNIFSKREINSKMNDIGHWSNRWHERDKFWTHGKKWRWRGVWIKPIFWGQCSTFYMYFLNICYELFYFIINCWSYSFANRFKIVQCHSVFPNSKKYFFQEYAVQNFDLYYDTDTQWPRVYGDQSNLTSCREKESVLQVI